MTSADGFTRYDILGDRVPEERAEKLHQRHQIEKRAERSAIRSKILASEAKNSPILATDAAVADAISEARVKSADAVAERIVGDLHSAGVKRARGGADPRVRHHKAKSAAEIKAETKAVLAAVDKAREDVIERGDPLAYVKVNVPAKPDALASQAEKKYYRAAVEDAIKLAEAKKASAEAFSSNVNAIKRAERAIAKGEAGLNALALEYLHPELFGKAKTNELETLRSLQDQLDVDPFAHHPATPVRAPATIRKPVSTRARKAPGTVRFVRKAEHRNPPLMFSPESDAEGPRTPLQTSPRKLPLPKLELGVDTPAPGTLQRSTRVPAYFDDEAAAPPPGYADLEAEALMQLTSELNQLKNYRLARETALTKASQDRKPTEREKIRKIDAQMNRVAGRIAELSGSSPYGKHMVAVPRLTENDPRALIMKTVPTVSVYKDKGAGAFPPGTTNVEAWFGPKGIVNGSNRLMKAKMRSDRKAQGGMNTGFFSTKRQTSGKVKPNISFVDVVKPFVSGALTALTL